MAQSIKGFCPMGCGETLGFSNWQVKCFAGTAGLDNPNSSRAFPSRLPLCPRPYAVRDILSETNSNHIVNLRETDFSMQHPLRERIDGELFDCPLDRYLGDLRPDELPIAGSLPGMFTVSTSDSGFVFDRLPDS